METSASSPQSRQPPATPRTGKLISGHRPPPPTRPPFPTGRTIGAPDLRHGDPGSLRKLLEGLVPSLLQRRVVGCEMWVPHHICSLDHNQRSALRPIEIPVGLGRGRGTYTYSEMSRTKRHHHSPQAYLKHFADRDGRLTVYDRINESCRNSR